MRFLDIAAWGATLQTPIFFSDSKEVFRIGTRLVVLRPGGFGMKNFISLPQSIECRTDIIGVKRAGAD